MDLLAGWPPAPTTAPTLGDVPLLLPAAGVPEADLALRREFGDVPVAEDKDFVQIWFSADGSAWFDVTTSIDQGIELRGDPVEIGLWDSAVVGPTGRGYVDLTMVEPTGYASVVSSGLDRDEAVEIARSMTRRTDGGPGWTIDAPDLSLIEQGWAIGAALRTVRWLEADKLQAELWIRSGQPKMFVSVATADSTTTLHDIGGATAVAVERDPALTLIVWSPQPDLQVYLGVAAPLDEALAIARSVGPVDLATWGSSSDVDTDSFDGCSGFLC